MVTEFNADISITKILQLTHKHSHNPDENVKCSASKNIKLAFHLETLKAQMLSQINS